MDAWRTDACPGYRTKTVRHGNCTIVIHRPELNQKEYDKQKQMVEHTLKHLKLNSEATAPQSAAC